MKSYFHRRLHGFFLVEDLAALFRKGRSFIRASGSEPRLSSKVVPVAKKILAIGDSQSKFWNGYHEDNVQAGAFVGVDCLHLGPISLLDLIGQRRAEQTFALIETRLKAAGDTYGALIFSFGGIDCERHVIKRAIVEDKTIDEVASSLASLYLQFVAGYAEKTGLVCLIYGPPPKSKRPLDHSPGVFGSITERNYAIMSFNAALSRNVKQCKSVGYFSIFNELLGPHREVKPTFYGDGVHPALGALELGEAALCRELERLGLLEVFRPALVRSWPIAANPGLRNVAIGAPITVSSTHSGHPAVPFPDIPDGELKFHTATEESPYVVIELDAAYFISCMKVHNRTIFQERAGSLTIAFSSNGQHFADVYTPEIPIIFGANAECLVVNVDPPRAARFVKLSLRQRNCLHLQSVELWAATFYSLDHRIGASRLAL